jgi:predicted Zn finger-like uncharacterized protein
MIIVCERCSTKYHIVDEAIGVNGRNVKCTKCSYIWFQELHSSNNVAKKKKEHSKNKNTALPVVIEYIVPKWFQLVPAFFMTIAIITGLFVFQEPLAEKSPYLSTFYNKIGVPVTTDMILNGVEIKEKENNILDINGFIVNKSDQHRRVPAVLINLVDNNNKMTSRIIPVSSSYLKKNEKHPFYKRIDDLPQNTKLVSVMIADKYDMLRY